MSLHNYTVESKFTRGEKCIFIHLVVTFILILILIVVYFCHLCLVTHTADNIFRITRRTSHDYQREEQGHIDTVGFLYLNVTPIRAICNTFLLRRKWSITAGHCVAMRSDPDLAYLLPAWRLKYQSNNLEETEIKRSIVHPHYNRNDFNNNIGLFEHSNPITAEDYTYPMFAVNDDTLHNANMFIISWKHSIRHKGETSEVNVMPIKPVVPENCDDLLAPILKMRKHEFCVMFDEQNDYFSDHGAVITMNSKAIGLFSWGPKNGKGVPLVMLNFVFYKDWLDFIVTEI